MTREFNKERANIWALHPKTFKFWRLTFKQVPSFLYFLREKRNQFVQVLCKLLKLKLLTLSFLISCWLSHLCDKTKQTYQKLRLENAVCLWLPLLQVLCKAPKHSEHHTSAAQQPHLSFYFKIHAPSISFHICLRFRWQLTKKKSSQVL